VIVAAKPTDDNYLTISEAARLFGVTRQQIHNLLNAGMLKTVERKVVVQLLPKADLEKIAKARGWTGKVTKRGRPTSRKK